MVSRSVGNPIFVGFSTTAILALSAGLSVALAEGTPSPTPASAPSRPAPPPAGAPGPSKPSAPESTTPTGSKPPDPSSPPTPKPVLYITLDLPSSAVHGGDSVKGRVYVHATRAEAKNTKVRLDATGGATVSPEQDLKTVDEENKSRDVTVTVPRSMNKGTIIVTAIASADGATTKKSTDRITVTKKPTPTPTPSNTTSSGTGSSGSSSGSSGSTGSTTPSGVTNSAGGAGYVPPSPSMAQQSPQVSLPEIAATPSTAPTMAAAAPTTTLRSGGSPQGQELTFERLASTQIAWLAALLVAFSVLMTQLRLGRPVSARVRPKGDHRRPRGGLFER
ncbi:MAG TPA: hypothetical protein VGP70_15310 [Actinomadura sp.]|nr:hypothetical protein [Actinomadura sp.]